MEWILLIVFLWLTGKTLGLAFRLTWGVAKIIASVLMAIALPAMVLALIFAGGIVLLVPLVLVALALGIIKLFC